MSQPYEVRPIYSRTDTGANWSTNNPVLSKADWAYDETARKYKVGDGVTAWNDLPYQTITGPELDARFSGKAGVDAGGNIVVPAGSEIRLLVGAKLRWTTPDGTKEYIQTINNSGVLSAPVLSTTSTPIPGDGGDTGGGTTPPPADNANLVTSNFTGNPTKTLNGTNIERGADQLIRYTRTTTQTVTPTNQYGIEVTVTTATGVVTAIVDRNAASIMTGTAIPSGSYVLSGHGWNGGATTAQWLWTNAQPGRTLTLTASVAPDPPPDPPPPPAGGGALPADVASIWHHGWSGPQPWTGYPSGAKTGTTAHNLIVLGLAQSGGSGTGNLSYYNRFGAGLATSIATAKAAGVNVVMGFGGSSDGGITITNNTQADQAYNSIVGFVNSYGITGVDCDMEPSGSSWTESALVRLATRLKTTYGASFIFGLTPGLYGEHTAKWLSAARALGSNYDYMAPMLYDFPEANLSNYPSVCINKCDVMAGGGVPASKMILGFMLKPPAETYPNSTDSVAKLNNAWNACKAKYPSLRGYFLWEDKIAQARGWDHLSLNTLVKS